MVDYWDCCLFTVSRTLTCGGSTARRCNRRTRVIVRCMGGAYNALAGIVGTAVDSMPASLDRVVATLKSFPASALSAPPAAAATTVPADSDTPVPAVAATADALANGLVGALTVASSVEARDVIVRALSVVLSAAPGVVVAALLDRLCAAVAASMDARNTNDVERGPTVAETAAVSAVLAGCIERCFDPASSSKPHSRLLQQLLWLLNEKLACAPPRLANGSPASCCCCVVI